MTSIRKTGLSAEPGPAASEYNYNKALLKARQLCASKECCKSDVLSRLEKWGISGQEQKMLIIEDLVSEKFIDEQRFASAYSRDKLRYNKWGKIKTGYALRQKGLPSDIIETALHSIDDDEYRTVAEKTVITLIKNRKNSNRQTELARILRSMQSKGFEYQLTAELLKEHF